MFISILYLALLAQVGANVIGIDFGSDNMKVGLVSPGKFDIGTLIIPLDIFALTICIILVTNGQSKRKTPQAVTFYNGERSFGADSLSLIARKPGAIVLNDPVLSTKL